MLTIRELALAVQVMRAWQKRYVADRSREALAESMAQEQAIDREVERIVKAYEQQAKGDAQ